MADDKIERIFMRILRLEDRVKVLEDSELQRLEGINAELIEALEAIVDHQYRVGGKLAVFSGTRAIAKSAIEKAKHDGSDRN